MDWAFPVHSFFSELAASCFVQGVGAVAWDEMWALFAMLPALITKRKVEVLFFSYFDVRYRSPAAAMDGWAGFLVKHHLATCLWVSGQVRAYGNCYGFGFCVQVCGLASRLATGMHGLCASQFR